MVHLDTHHKLIRWRFVVVGAVDGFYRKIFCMKLDTNNKAKTVLKHFLTGVKELGLPSRVRYQFPPVIPTQFCSKYFFLLELTKERRMLVLLIWCSLQGVVIGPVSSAVGQFTTPELNEYGGKCYVLPYPLSENCSSKFSKYVVWRKRMWFLMLT